MDNDRTGQAWPLGLLFVLTLCGGFIGLVLPLLGGNFDKRVAGLLLIAAFLSGALLYIPNWAIARKIPNLATLTGRVDEIRTALLGAQGNQNKLAGIETAIGELRTQISDVSKQITDLNARLNADGDVRKKLDAIEEKIK